MGGSGHDHRSRWSQATDTCRRTRRPVRSGSRSPLAAPILAGLLLAACTGGSQVPETRSPASGKTESPTGSQVSCPPVPVYPKPDPNRPVYVLRIRLLPERHLVTVEMRVTFAPDVPTDRLVFRLWPNSPPQAAEGAHLSIGTVRSSGRPLRTEKPNPTTLMVTPPHGELGV